MGRIFPVYSTILCSSARPTGPCRPAVYQTVLKPTDRNLFVLLDVQYRLPTTTNTSSLLAKYTTNQGPDAICGPLPLLVDY